MTNKMNKASWNSLTKFIFSGLWLTSSLYAMEGPLDRSTPYHVTSHRGNLSMNGGGVTQEALEVYVTFPYHVLANRPLAPWSNGLMSLDRLRTDDLRQVIDNETSLRGISLDESRKRAWEELENRLGNDFLTNDQKAGIRLGLAKMVMASNYHHSRFAQPSDCYNFVLGHLFHTMERAEKGIEKRKKSHARIWAALMLAKRNIVMEGYNRQQTLQKAWNLLQEAYDDSATKATLFFQMELILRFGFRPGECSATEAFEKARFLFNQINDKSKNTKRIIRSFANAQHSSLHNDRYWRLARAAFLKDIGEELDLLGKELEKVESGPLPMIDAPIQEEVGDPFHRILFEEETNAEPQPLSINVVTSSESSLPVPTLRTLPVELEKVKNLIAPHETELMRAYSPENGAYIFFNEYDVSGFQNNCAFNCMGLTRQEALESLLANAHRVDVRQLVVPQIVMHMINHTMPSSLDNVTISVNRASGLKTYKGRQIYRYVQRAQAALSRANLENREEADEKYQRALRLARRFAQQEQTFQAFVRYALSDNRMMEYLRNDNGEDQSTILNALALIHNFNLEIWTASDTETSGSSPTLQRVAHYTPSGADRTVRMRHMRLEIDGQNHFRFLLPFGASQFVPQITSSMDGSETEEDERDIVMESTPSVSTVHVETHQNRKKRSHSEMERPEEMTRAQWALIKRKVGSLHKKGNTKEAIAGVCKISCEKVAEILEHDFGVKKRKHASKLSKKQQNMILRQVGSTVTQKHVDNLKLHATIAQEVKCNQTQVKRFLARQLKGLPTPLESVHEGYIEELAFDDQGVRTKLTVKTITDRLNKKFKGQRFEGYQVMNYIRILLKKEGYTFPLKK